MDDVDMQCALEASFASQQAERAAAKRQRQEECDQDLAVALTKSQEDFAQYQASVNLNEWKITNNEDVCKGSWDCTGCTLTNRPYEPSCRACNNKAPDHVLTFKEFPSIQFGLEIEIIISNGKHDGFTYESIASALSRFMEKPVRFEGYTHETRDHWKLVTDASIHGSSKDLCFELVSPILKDEEGLSSLRAIMDGVRRLGIATNTSCGFHVHVDAEQDSSPVASLPSLKRIAQCFVSLENALDLLVARSWDTSASKKTRRADNNRYCQSNRLAFGERSNRQRWQQLSAVQSKQQLVSLINPSGDRYRKLNLTNITKQNRPSTIEFRQHGGVQDLQEAEAWVRLTLLFCQNSALGGLAVNACCLPEGCDVRDELLALFRLVADDGLEQFFVVERRLFSDLRQEWTCRACRRKFRTSRSLSQHKEACGH